ncbi:hypothetical protein KUTeg_016312 [Tegillarca granosa]|uniref:FAS1 domain-containing protein n=1 Tax=Tegillarca granosa TaxID=220873 RepID=A0ABQ9EKI0_TEGGR|nr:hypothetical protein KUTeg_016312 [Tegillarca granosa]
MSKVFLAFFLIVAFVAITEAWPRGRGWGRGRGIGMLGRHFGRDIPSEVGRGFRRWMRRDNQEETDVDESEVDQETPTDDDTDDKDNGDDDIDDSQPWQRENERFMRNRHWRRRQGHNRRGERCRGPGCRRNRQNTDNDEDISDIIGTNGNPSDVNQPDPIVDTIDSDNLPLPSVDRIPGRHRFRNRWNNRNADRQMQRRINRNRQPWQRRMGRWRDQINRRTNIQRQRNGRRNDRKLRHRYNFGWGNGLFNIDFDFIFGKQKQWWVGPNVCYSTTTRDNKTADISPHNELYSKKCDDTGTAYKCVSTVIKMMTEKTTTEVRECCAGYTRKSGDYGCPIEVNLENIVETARDLELNEFIRATDSVGLLSELERENFTVFAPVDAAFEDLDGIIQTDSNLQLQDMGSVVVVSKPLTTLLVSDLQNLLLGHLSFDTLTTSKLNDEQLVETGSPFKSKIRVNFYGNSEKLMTANCKKVKSRDNIATNGVIHVVEGLLEPVTESLLEIVSKNPQLSYLKTAVFEGKKFSTNLLNKHLKLERDENDKLFVEGVQIVDVDVMGTNGVLYLIDKVLLSDDDVICCAGITKDDYFGRSIRTMSGEKRKVTVRGDSPVINGKDIISCDITATNGVVHVIDEAMLPEKMQDMFDFDNDFWDDFYL